MKTSLPNDRDIFAHFLKGDALRRLRHSTDALLGRPLWWVTFRPNGGAKALKEFADLSHTVWGDSRIRKFRSLTRIWAYLASRPKDLRPHFFTAPRTERHYLIPLVSHDRLIGHLGLSGLKRVVLSDLLHLAASQVHALLETAARKEELDRVSATIRPRAIALSTVHTVHRIINSTLNLDELISRLGHLTAQVLRANRCSIYLLESKTSQGLLLRARVGFPKHAEPPLRLAAGAGLQGRVARTAQVVLRKKFIAVPLIDEDVIGVLTISHKKDRKPFSYFDQEILTTLAEEAVIAIKNAQLYEEQKKVTLGTIQSLAVILGTHTGSPTSPDQFLRVVLKLAEEIRLSDEDTQALHYATLLKDTAKIGIPEEILKKPTKLTGEEYRILREHPIKGAKIVQSFESLKPVVPIILYSREKFDGTGYPKGLKGEKIPVGARILAVLNAFEAIIIGRPYRNRATFREACEELQKNRGTQFDPKIVDLFVKIIEKENYRKFLKNDR